MIMKHILTHSMLQSSNITKRSGCVGRNTKGSIESSSCLIWNVTPPTSSVKHGWGEGKKKKIFFYQYCSLVKGRLLFLMTLLHVYVNTSIFALLKHSDNSNGTNVRLVERQSARFTHRRYFGWRKFNYKNLK